MIIHFARQARTRKVFFIVSISRFNLLENKFNLKNWFNNLILVNIQPKICTHLNIYYISNCKGALWIVNTVHLHFVASRMKLKANTECGSWVHEACTAWPALNAEQTNLDCGLRPTRNVQCVVTNDRLIN